MRIKSFRKTSVALFGALVVIVLTACGQPTPTVAPTRTLAPTNTRPAPTATARIIIVTATPEQEESVTATPEPTATPIEFKMALGEEAPVTTLIDQSGLLEVIRGDSAFGVGQGVQWLTLEEKIIDREHAWWRAYGEELSGDHVQAVVRFDNRMGTWFILKINCHMDENYDTFCSTNLPNVGEGKTAFIIRFWAYGVYHQLSIWYTSGADVENAFGIQHLPDYREMP